jgi:Flagellar hook-basal body protein
MTDLSVAPVLGVSSSNIVDSVPAAAGAAGADKPSFGYFLRRAAANAVESVHAGEKAMVAGLEGRLGSQEVVNAVLAAENTLQTVVAVRDRIVNAYQEIMRMPI